MPRRAPSRLRAPAPSPRSAVIPGVPLATSRALDRLDRADISSAQVKEALETWQRTAALSWVQLNGPTSDWTLSIGPDARADLERALPALPARKSARLRAAVERADEAFRAKTLHNPRTDRSQPWWARRWGP